MARASSPHQFLGAAVTVALVVLAAAPSALAGDPDYLQDLCVADLNSGKLQPLPCTLPLHLCATPKMFSVVRIVVCCSGTDPEKA